MHLFTDFHLFATLFFSSLLSSTHETDHIHGICLRICSIRLVILFTIITGISTRSFVDIASLDIATINERKGHRFEIEKEGFIGGFEGKKGGRKHVIILKSKKN